MKASNSNIGVIASFLVSLITIILPTVNARPWEASAIRPEDLLNLREFGSLGPIEISSDGKLVICEVHENRQSIVVDPSESLLTGVPWYGKGMDILLVNTETQASRTLTRNGGSNWSPKWSPDGQHVAFLSDRDGSARAKLWVWDRPTDALRKISDLPVRAGGIEWMPNSEDVLTTIFPEDRYPDANRAFPAESVKIPQNEIGTRRSTVVLYSSNSVSAKNSSNGVSDPWVLENNLDLVLMNIRTSQVKILVRNKSISQYSPSPDGSNVAFTTPKRFEKPGSQQILWDLSIVAVSSGKQSLVASDVRFDYDGASFSWSPDSLHVAYLAGGPMEFETGHGDCILADLNGGPPLNITSFRGRGPRQKQRRPLWDAAGKLVFMIRGDSVWKAETAAQTARQLAAIPGHRVVEFVAERNLLWSPDGGKSTVVLTFDDEARQSGFYKLQLEEGATARLLEKGQCYTCVNTNEHVSAVPNGRELVYASQDSQHYDDLWMSDFNFRSRRRLTHLNPALDRYQMGKARLVEWRSSDGDLLQGSLLLPSGYEEGRRYPLIVWVYGGDRGSDHVNNFGVVSGSANNLQLLATRGYAVLFPDAPQQLGTPMADLARTVLPGVSKVIEMGIADPDCLGVIGHSYGGYSALSLIVQTKLFKAAVVEDGIGDLISAYGQMNENGAAFGTSVAEHGQELMGGTPWDYRDRYIENSPLFFLDRVQTPVLIVHGASDTTVAAFLGDEIFVGLRRLGKEVEYAKYEGESHSPSYWSYANQLDLCHRVITWFDDHLKKQQADSARVHR